MVATKHTPFDLRKMTLAKNQALADLLEYRDFPDVCGWEREVCRKQFITHESNIDRPRGSDECKLRRIIIQDEKEAGIDFVSSRGTRKALRESLAAELLERKQRPRIKNVRPERELKGTPRTRADNKALGIPPRRHMRRNIKYTLNTRANREREQKRRKAARMHLKLQREELILPRLKDNLRRAELGVEFEFQLAPEPGNNFTPGAFVRPAVREQVRVRKWTAMKSALSVGGNYWGV